MELKLYLAIVRRHLWLILAIVGLGLALAALATAVMPKTYVAKATLRMPTVIVGSDTSNYFDIAYSERLISTFTELAQGAALQQRLDEQPGAGQFVGVQVDGGSGSELVKIAVEATSPELAAEGATIAAGYLIEQSQNMNLDIVRSSIRLNPLLLAVPVAVPQVPERPRLPLNLIVGLVGGLLGGLMLAFLRENLAPRLYLPEQIEALAGVPVMADLAARRRGQRSEGPGNIELLSLGARLAVQARNHGLRSLVLASSAEAPNQAHLAVRLASILAEAGISVALVDADWYAPQLHDLLHLPNNAGLSQVLLGETSLEEGLQQGPQQHLQVLTSGAVAGQQGTLLMGAAMEELLGKLTEKVSLVLVYASSVDCAETSHVAHFAEGTLLLVAGGQTRRDHLESGLQRMRSLGACLRGVVLVSGHQERGAGRLNRLTAQAPYRQRLEIKGGN